MRKTIDFLQLTSKLPYPPAIKGKLSTIHATVMDQFLSTYTNKHTEKLYVVHAINCISYMYISSDSLPFGWREDDPIHTFYNYDDDFLEESLSKINMYITTKDIDWTNVTPVESSGSISSDLPAIEITPVAPSVTLATPKQTQMAIGTLPVIDQVSSVYQSPILNLINPTDKSDLYIQPPAVPRFDSAHPIVAGVIDDCAYTIYPSYPIIPTKQNEISMTTDVNKMSDQDLRRLFPNCLIRTRSACMYEPCDGLVMDSKLGVLIPVEGYTKSQLIDNLVRYPHIFRLLKVVNGTLDSFYSTIEIGGELYKISDVWKTLPESDVVPYTKEFVKEYVVRRYLLERDIKGIQHKYPMYGSLDPFLTLFTTVDDYANFGYTDPVQIARNCVLARVAYKKSRNPIMRRLQNA